jgi:hypothetical protein
MYIIFYSTGKLFPDFEILFFHFFPSLGPCSGPVGFDEMEKGTHLALLFDIAQLITDLNQVVNVVFGVLEFSIYPDVYKNLLDDFTDKICKYRISLVGVFLLNQVEFFGSEYLGLMGE